MKKSYSLSRKVVAAACSLSLVAMMAPSMALATPTSATDVADSTVKISGLTAGDTVSAYLIADADIDGTNNLSYTFATGVPEAYNTEGKLAAITSDGNTFVQGSDAQNAAAAIANGIIGNGAAATATATGTEATLTLGSGYYLVRVSSTSGETKVYQNMLVDVSPVVENGVYVPKTFADALNVKSTDVTITKTVGNGDKSTDAYKIGDMVPFTIETAVPNYPADAANATFEIADTPTAGLEIDTTSITVEGATDADYTLNATATGYTVVFNKDFILANPAAAIKVTYQAKLTSAAFSTAAGTTGNTANVKFNPNPYDNTTATPEDSTTVQTYGFVFPKITVNTDKTELPLEGAVFQLFDANGNAIVDENGNDITSTSKIVNGVAYVYFEDLAAGDYIAKEIKVPAGYLKAPDVNFSLSAATCTADNPATTDIVENNYLVSTDKVVDPKVYVLPATGGMGTMAITAAGLVLVAGAALLIVRNRRKNQSVS
ncbi:MAG: SpaH/EbpB family LPXTG-anchored major pilin [Coriobacteriia bacterium]|nr:SpaH/EbpB family LPXTG-anchored major pilin [Coriobacteriia bacterium]